MDVAGPTTTGPATGVDLRSSVARAAVIGVGTALLRPARVPTGIRRGWHLGLAAVAGLGMYAGGPTASTPTRRIALAVAVASLAGGSSAAGSALDTAAERALVTRGVRHPRWWIGAVAAATTELVDLARVVTGPGPTHPPGGDRRV